MDRPGLTAHPLVGPAVDALEALGGWQPPDDRGKLVEELNGLLPGIEEVLCLLWQSLAELAGTLKFETPVADTVVDVIHGMAGVARQAACDDDVADQWRIADAADIARDDAPRPGEEQYNVDGPGGPASTAAAVPGHILDCYEPGCDRFLDITVRHPVPDMEDAARAIAEHRHGWNIRPGWDGCPDHEGLDGNGRFVYVYVGYVLLNGVVRCEHDDCDARFTLRVVVKNGPASYDKAYEQARQEAAAEHGWQIRPGWDGCPAHPRTTLADAAAVDPTHPIAARMATGEVSRARAGSGNIGVTDRITLADGTTVIEKFARNYPGLTGVISDVEQQDAEELSAAVGKALGLRTPTVYRAAPDTIFMDDLPGKPACTVYQTANPAVAEIAETQAGRLAGVLDIVTDNSDRHSGNWLVDPDTGDISLIDHGLSFRVTVNQPDDQWANAPYGCIQQEQDTDPVRRPFSAPFLTPPGYGERMKNTGWAQNPIHPDDCPEIARRLASTMPEFDRLGRRDWFNLMILRWWQIEKHAAGTQRFTWEPPEKGSP